MMRIARMIIALTAIHFYRALDWLVSSTEKSKRFVIALSTYALAGGWGVGGWGWD